MINGKRVLAIVPARGGSKGIPKKNIIDVEGKPLIQYTLDEAKKSKYIDEIHISTNDDEIIQVVQQLGYNIIRKRPEELAQDHSQTIDVLDDVLQYYINKNKIFDIVVTLQPTQPLRKSFHIDEAIELYDLNGNKGVVGISATEQNPVLIRKINADGHLENILNVNSTVRRQDFERYYIVNGAIYINSSADIRRKASLNDNKIPYLMLSDYVNIDIDTFEDLEKFKRIVNKIKF